MTATPADSPAPARSRSPRSTAMRRLAGCLIVVLLMLAVRLIWGWHTTSALRAQMAELRARGEPIEAADFPFVKIPDDQNAARYQQDAARAAVPGADPPRATNMTYRPYPPHDEAWMAAAESSERAHGKLFALAREARRHPRVQWNAQPFTAPLTLLTPMAARLNTIRHLANILADSAELAHVQGNDAQAIERVRDLLHLGRSLRHDDTMIGQLVAMGIDALGCNVALTLAPGLRLDAPSGAASAPTTRAAAQALIAELLDEELLRQGLARSFRFERAVMHETRQKDGAGTWVIRPLAGAQLVREHRNFDVYIDAAALPNKPQVTAALRRATVERPNRNDPRDVPRYSRWFGWHTYFDRYFQTSFRVLAERRMTAASLAAQLFRADHGRWPNTLDELVPNYLPSVPLDPFTDDKPLGYVLQHRALPDGGDRPLVFHTGGEIDIGPYPEPSYSWEIDRRPGVTVRKELWQYRDLARFVPATQPASTQAVDDQP